MFSTIRSWCIALIIGVVYYFAIGFIWGYLAVELWTTGWLFDLLQAKKISRGLFYAVIYPHDILINLLLALPFAYLLSLIKPDRKWLYVALAVIPMGLYGYRVVILEGVIDFFLIGGVGAIFGVLTAFGSLPAALYVVSFFGRKKGLLAR